MDAPADPQTQPATAASQPIDLAYSRALFAFEHVLKAASHKERFARFRDGARAVCSSQKPRPLTKEEANKLIDLVIKGGLRIEQDAAEKLGVGRVRMGMDGICLLIELWTENYEVAPAEEESLRDLVDLTICMLETLRLQEKIVESNSRLVEALINQQHKLDVEMLFQRI